MHTRRSRYWVVARQAPDDSKLGNLGIFTFRQNTCDVLIIPMYWGREFYFCFIILCRKCGGIVSLVSSLVQFEKKNHSDVQNWKLSKSFTQSRDDRCLSTVISDKGMIKWHCQRNRSIPGWRNHHLPGHYKGTDSWRLNVIMLATQGSWPAGTGVQWQWKGERWEMYSILDLMSWPLIWWI